MKHVLLTTLFFCFLLVPAQASMRLIVNGQDVDTISLAGEATHQIEVEIVGTPTDYSMEIGFESPDPTLGTLSLYKIMSEAGNDAKAVVSSYPGLVGFTLTAGDDAKEGTQFIFEYLPTEIGTTRLVLFETDTLDRHDYLDITITDPVAPESEVNVFTYQGRLNDDGSPADGLYDLQFTLFADATHAMFGQVSPVLQLDDIDVVDGYFTVDLDFGGDPNLLNGDRRWLEIAVRPGASAGDYETLSPRQRLRPAPYAVRALETEAKLAALQAQVDQLTALLSGITRNGDTLLFEGMNLQVVNGTDNTWDTNGLGNIIVGYNEEPFGETPTRSGSHNLVVGQGHSYSSYAGFVAGERNTISAEHASVLGGTGNEAAGGHSVVAGGAGNTAHGSNSAVLGGGSNLAEATQSAVVGGRYGQASAQYAVVVGGGYTDSDEGNIANGLYATVVGGRDNIATGERSVIIGGSDNQTSGRDSVIGGGTNNDTTADATVVSGGHNLDADSAYEVLTGRKPAYDSGWGEMQRSTKVFDHNLGGDVDDYVVVVNWKNQETVTPNHFGVNNRGEGGNHLYDGTQYWHTGVFWEELTSTQILVTRLDDDINAEEVRVRIWVEE